MDITSSLKPGENELQFDVRNAGGIAGLVAKLGWVDDQDHLTVIASGEDWEVTAAGASADYRPAKRIAAYGDAPWRRVLDRASPGGTNAFALLPGFAIERIFRVPKEEFGSWVCLTVDPQGRLIASNQEDRGLFRITPPKPGTDVPTRVEKLNVNVSGAQGLLFAFDSLYVSVNGGIGSGLYRLRGTNGRCTFAIGHLERCMRSIPKFRAQRTVHPKKNSCRERRCRSPM